MLSTLKTLSFILRHPLNRQAKLRAFSRYLRWQVASRLVDAPIAVPFVDSTRLLVSSGMTGATGNVYCGLHEYRDMSFVLHALTADDLFVDVGANVGTYTILAAGAAGSSVVSLEPHPRAYAHLLANIRFNDLGDK